MGKTSSRGDAAIRAERKFEKKMEFYAKVRHTVTSLAAQKSIAKQKLGVSSFVEAPYFDLAAKKSKHEEDKMVKKKTVRSRKKKLKAYDLSSLSEFLPELKAAQQPKPAKFKLNSKSRQNLVLKEGSQLQAVINHPAFQSDPLGAIHQHLQSTQPTVDEKPKRRENRNGNRKGKKKSKASVGPRSMEI